MFISDANGIKFYRSEFTFTTTTINDNGSKNGTITVNTTACNPKFAINKNKFQDNNVFSNLEGNKNYLIGVLDCTGKLSFAIVNLGKAVNCSDYNNSTLQTTINTNQPLKNFLNCTLNNFL